MLYSIIFLGILLRLLFFQQITFGYDQARDVLEAISIWTTNHIKVIGPTSDLPGINHGVLYWYLISPFYFFSHGNVLVIRFLMIILGSLNIWFIYYFVRRIFNHKTMALLCSLFMAISFEASQYSRWLSNPSPALLSVAIFYFGLYGLISAWPFSLPITLISLAASIHFEFFLVYLCPILFMTVVVKFLYLGNLYKIKNYLAVIVNKKTVFFSFFSLALMFPFLAKELRFDFRTIRALLNFATDSQVSAVNRTTTLIPHYFEKISINLSNNFGRFDINIYSILIIILVGYAVKLLIKRTENGQKILFFYLWLLSPMALYLFERSNAYFLNIGTTYPLIIIVSYILIDIYKRNSVLKYLVLVLIVVTVIGNISAINKYNRFGETLFAVQEEDVYSDKIKVIDWTYKKSGGKMFRINTITNPLFINTTWAYLYKYYGEKKYGYMPEWGGYPQEGEGVFGKEIIFSKYNDQTKILYLIIEPSSVFPRKYLFAYEKFENQRSTIQQTAIFGKHAVQKRQINTLKYFSRDDIFNYSLEFKEN